MIQQPGYLAGEIATADAEDIANIGGIHPNQKIATIVVYVLQLPGLLACAVYTVLGQLTPG